MLSEVIVSVSIASLNLKTNISPALMVFDSSTSSQSMLLRVGEMVSGSNGPVRYGM